MSEIDAAQLAQRCAEQMWSDDNASEYMGMAIEYVGPGEATLSMTVRPEMVNGHDICHGGYIFSLADSAFAFACNSFNQVAVAASCSIDYVRPATLGQRLVAKASMIHQGRRTGIYKVEITNQNNDLIAHFQGRSARLGRPVLGEAVASEE